MEDGRVQEQVGIRRAVSEYWFEVLQKVKASPLAEGLRLRKVMRGGYLTGIEGRYTIEKTGDGEGGSGTPPRLL